MLIIKVKIDGDPGPTLEMIQAIMVTDRRGLMAVAGRTMTEQLKKHFAKLQSIHPNKMGGKRQNFWRAVRDTVQNPQPVGRDGSLVAINHSVMPHKAGVGPQGGWIYPKDKKWLAIPVIREAYGMSPIEWSEGGGTDRELHFFKQSDEKALLAEVTVTHTPDMTRYNLDDDKHFLEGGQPKAKAPSKKIELRVIFVLRKKVFQKPQPDALPEEATWQKTIGGNCRLYITETLAKAGKGPSQPGKLS